MSTILVTRRDVKQLVLDVADVSLRRFLLDLPSHTVPTTRILGPLRYLVEKSVPHAFDRLDISTDEEFRALRDDLRWLHDCRKTLAGLRQKLFWLVISFVVVGLLGFCAQSTLDGIKRGLNHETREYPPR